LNHGQRLRHNTYILMRFFSQILQLPIYSIDISDLSYKYLALRQNKSGIVVSDFGEGDIPAGIIENGEIKQAESLSSLLRSIFAKRNIRFIAISLPDEKGFLKSIKIPSNVLEDELDATIGLALEEHIPLPTAEAAFDYVVVGKDNANYDIVLRAFPRIIIDGYLSALSSAGAKPVLAEPELSAMVRAVVRSDEPASAMLIDWGKTRTSFAIFDHATVRFAATAPLGGNAITDAIMKELKVGKEEAEQIKRAKDRLSVDIRSASAGGLLGSVIPILSAMSSEAERYMRFWNSHAEGNKPITRVYLVGGDVNINGLPEYLAKKLGVDVVFGNPWRNVMFPSKYLPEIFFKDSLRFTSALGLSLKALEESQIL